MNITSDFPRKILLGVDGIDGTEDIHWYEI
jgi:hypothetical protein